MSLESSDVLFVDFDRSFISNTQTVQSFTENVDSCGAVTKLLFVNGCNVLLLSLRGKFRLMLCCLSCLFSLCLYVSVIRF